MTMTVTWNIKTKLQGDSVMEVMIEGDVITLISASKPLELFYLCKVISFSTVTRELRDENSHYIVKGNSYIMATYFEIETW